GRLAVVVVEGGGLSFPRRPLGVIEGDRHQRTGRACEVAGGCIFPAVDEVGALGLGCERIHPAADVFDGGRLVSLPCSVDVGEEGGRCSRERCAVCVVEGEGDHGVSGMLPVFRMASEARPLNATGTPSATVLFVTRLRCVSVAAPGIMATPTWL